MNTNDNRSVNQGGYPSRNADVQRSNPDPISGAPGSHPVGSGLGATAGGVAGLGIGAAVGGPVGAAIGAAAGAVAGGLGGKSVAEAIDPTEEESHWRSQYAKRPYVGPDEPFELYLPAYRLGWESRATFHREPALTFDDVEDRLSKEWNSLKTKSALTWERAKNAVRDAWDRIAIDRAENEGMPPLHRRDSASDSASRGAPQSSKNDSLRGNTDPSAKRY